MNRPVRTSVSDRCQRGKSLQRSGFGVTEMLVAMILIGAMASYLMPVMYRTSVLERQLNTQVDWKQRALNVIEMLHAWESQEQDFWSQTPEQLVERLNAVQQEEPLILELTVTSLPAEGRWPARRQVEVVIRPREETVKIKPVACTTWFVMTEGEN